MVREHIKYVRKNNAATRGSNLETAWRSCIELIKHVGKNTFQKAWEQLHREAIIVIGPNSFDRN